jgi:hypothetical protein
VNNRGNRIRILHIRIGFSGVVVNANYADSHQALPPFGLKWGRGILVRGPGYFEAITGPCVISHSTLKNEMEEEETSCGAFYFGYTGANKTLYLEYASDRNFDFRDEGTLDAIVNSLRSCSGPFQDCQFGAES